MQILVAGASGVIGRPLVQRLLALHHDVVGLVHSPSGGETVRSLGAVPVVADVLDADSLMAALRGMHADVVVHQLTAYRNAPPTRYGGRGVRRTNALRTQGSEALLQAAESLGATRFVTQSLILGYGLVDHGDQPITEAMPFGWIREDRSDSSIWALKEAEMIANQGPGIAGIALRYGIFYGPGASDMFAKMLKRMALPLPNRDTGHIGWIHIDDAVEATVAAIEHGRAGQAYNIVDDDPVPWDTMLDAMAATVGARRPLRLPAPLVRLGAPFAATQMLDTSMRVSNALAAETLGWKPSWPSYTEGLRTLA